MKLKGDVLVKSLPPQPFLRWAGGKRRLASLISEAFPTGLDYSKARFFEPFVGGGSMMFHLGDPSREHFFPGSRIYINDSNPDLVTTYKIVRDEVEALCVKLSKLSKDVSKETYEKIRASEPKTNIEIAARFIYLNKTCFNGLWRVNNSGKFNVPWGQLKNPKIYDEQVLFTNSKRLRAAKISNKDFQSHLSKAQSGDLVYLDPPYIPISASSNFSKYSQRDFGIADHERLAEEIKALKRRGVFVVLSNSDSPETRRIFENCLNLYQIKVTRSISAKSSSRMKVNEIIGTNYPVPKLSQLAELHRVN